jgi:mercuric ion transport protein
MQPDSTRNASLAGAVVSALAASACCIGPLAFAMLGLGGAGFLVAMEPYRPVFTVVTLGLLGVGFYTTYRSQPAQADDCGCESPNTNRFGRWMLWGATGVALLALASPSLIPHLF